jgi:uncharacterized membrane protein
MIFSKCWIIYAKALNLRPILRTFKYCKPKSSKMKTLLLAVALVLVSAVSVNAQKTTFSLAGNAGAGITKYYGLTAGGDLQADIHATTGLKITVSGGYENFAYKVPVTSGSIKGHSSFIPLLAGAKFSLGGKAYGHAQLGYSISTISGGSGAFTYAPSIGFMLSPNWDLSAKYLGLSFNGGTLSAVVARLAYSFGK